MVTLAVFASATAQTADSVDVERWDFHLSTGTSVTFAGREAMPRMWTAPSVTFRPNDRLTLRGGFLAVGSSPDAYRLHGLQRPSLAPRRRTTSVAAAGVEADYRVSDRLWVWASVWRAGGWLQPWFDPTGEAHRLGITSFSGGFDLKLGEGSALSMSFSMVRDDYGTLFDMPGFYRYGGAFAPEFDLFCHPGGWMPGL